MTRERMIAMLNNNDLYGVGAVISWADGSTTYNFYEDFDNDKGIDRAARQFQNLIDAGKVRRVDYVYQTHKHDAPVLKDGTKVTMHWINHWMHEVPTEDTPKKYAGQVYEVKTVNGKQGIDGNPEQNPYTCRGNIFTPFSIYAWTIIFKAEDTGRLYRYDNIKNGLEDVTGLEDGYIDKIVWNS